MQSSIMIKPTALCLHNHPQDKIYFCKNCAIAKKSIEFIFFCIQCNKAALQIHSHMSDRYSIVSKNFKVVYQDFKSHFQTINKMRSIDFVHKNFPEKKNLSINQCLDFCFVYMKQNQPVYYKALFNKSISRDEFQSFSYRKWLIQNAFWHKPYSGKLNNQIDTYICGMKIGDKQQNSKWSNFKLDFDPLNSNNSINLSQQMIQARKKIQNIKKQKNISDLFLSISTCISQQQIQNCLKECENVNKQYNSSLFLISLGKLKLFELHPKSSQQLTRILGEIKVETLNPREKELYYYFMAIKQWVIVDDPQKQSKNSMLFLQSRNKKYYKLKNSKNYINSLTSAINISHRQVYLASRAIGYMIQKKNKEAQADFYEAEALSYNNDALRNNHNLNKLILNIKLQRFELLQNLSLRTTQYIINLTKYLKKNKQFVQLMQCYEELLSRQPNNINFKVGKLDTLIKLNNSVGAREEISDIKSMKKLTEEEIINFQRKIELLKAKQQQQFNNYSDAEQRYQNVARLGKSSATHWYNYANFLFKNRQNHENNEKCLKAINESLEIKQKQKYYELKFLILFCMGNFQQAKKIQNHLKNPKYNEMKQYVNENI